MPSVASPKCGAVDDVAADQGDQDVGGAPTKATSIAPPMPSAWDGSPLANCDTHRSRRSMRQTWPGSSSAALPPSVTYNASSGPMVLPDPSRCRTWPAASPGRLGARPLTGAAMESATADRDNAGDRGPRQGRRPCRRGSDPPAGRSIRVHQVCGVVGHQYGHHRLRRSQDAHAAAASHRLPSNGSRRRTHRSLSTSA